MKRENGSNDRRGSGETVREALCPGICTGVRVALLAMTLAIVTSSGARAASCTFDDECATGWYCDESLGSCAEKPETKTCLEDSDCKPWEFCATWAGICVAGADSCLFDDDCPVTHAHLEVCDSKSHRCVTPEGRCFESLQCDNYFEECGEDRYCHINEGYCISDGDCKHGERCSYNMCVEVSDGPSTLPSPTSTDYPDQPDNPENGTGVGTGAPDRPNPDVNVTANITEVYRCGVNQTCVLLDVTLTVNTRNFHFDDTVAPKIFHVHGNSDEAIARDPNLQCNLYARGICHVLINWNGTDHVTVGTGGGSNCPSNPCASFGDFGECQRDNATLSRCFSRYYSPTAFYYSMMDIDNYTPPGYDYFVRDPTYGLMFCRNQERGAYCDGIGYSDIEVHEGTALLNQSNQPDFLEPWVEYGDQRFYAAPVPIPDILPRQGLFPVPVVYTTKNKGYERVFTPGDNLQLHVIFRDVKNQGSSGQFNITISGPITKSYTTSASLARRNSTDLNLSIPLSGFPAGRYTIKIAQDCVNLPEKESDECNRRNTNGSTDYAFYVDELGVPPWSRDLRMLNIAEPMRASMEADQLNQRYSSLLNELGYSGFNTAYVGVEYYQYNWFGAHQPVVRYWIPSGTSPDTHYSNPPGELAQQAGGIEQARDDIRNLVGEAHGRNLKVIGYMEPMFIYSPESQDEQLTCEGPLETCWYFIFPYQCCKSGTDVAHQYATSPSYVRFNDSNTPRRVYWEEWKVGSLVNEIGVETSFCPARANLQVDTNGPFIGDSDYPYHLAHEAGWLSEHYGFDGVVLDDIGRAHLKYGSRSDLNDISSRIHAVPPSETYYCDTPYACCGSDQQTLDSISIAVLETRRSFRGSSSDKTVIISDYASPADSGWDSLYGSSDVYSSDQYLLLKQSFAQYAYTNWNASFKPIKTDMRRSLPDVQIPLFDITIPITNILARQQRPAWLRGTLTAIAWSNRVGMEVTYNELKERCDGSNQDTCLLFQHYHAMRDAASTPELPVFSTQVSQELLYHSLLPESRNNGELLYCGTSEGEECVPYQSSTQFSAQPYTVLYRLPGPGGEKARVLHVINTRAFCAGETDQAGDCARPVDNWAVPSDYYFKVRIPEGYNVSRVVLVSPDTKTGLPESPRYRQYTYGVPSASLAALREGDYIKIKLSGDDRVATYTAVYIGLEPEWS